MAPLLLSLVVGSIGVLPPISALAVGESFDFVTAMERFGGWAVVAWVVYYLLNKHEKALERLTVSNDTKMDSISTALASAAAGASKAAEAAAQVAHAAIEDRAKMTDAVHDVAETTRKILGNCEKRGGGC